MDNSSITSLLSVVESGVGRGLSGGGRRFVGVCDRGWFVRGRLGGCGAEEGGGRVCGSSRMNGGRICRLSMKTTPGLTKFDNANR